MLLVVRRGPLAPPAARPVPAARARRRRGAARASRSLLTLVALPIERGHALSGRSTSGLVDPVLGRAGPGTSPGRRRSARCSPAPATAGAIALMRRFPRRWWIPASGARRRARRGVHLRRPARPGPDLQPLRAAARRAGPQPTCSTWRAAPACEVGQVYVVDASQRTTAANAYVTGLGSSKRVVLYDTLLERLPARRDAPRRRPRARPRPLPRRAARRCSSSRSSRPPACSPPRRLTRRLGPAATACPPARRACPALFALGRARRRASIGTVSNQLSRRVEARADSYALRLTGDAPTVHRLSSGASRCRTSATRTRPRWRGALLGTHPTTRERLGIGLAYERGARPATPARSPRAPRAPGGPRPPAGS